MILRWVIGSGAAIGALDEGLLYMKEVRNGEERRGKERREEKKREEEKRKGEKRREERRG